MSKHSSRTSVEFPPFTIAGLTSREMSGQKKALSLATLGVTSRILLEQDPRVSGKFTK